MRETMQTAKHDQVTEEKNLEQGKAPNTNPDSSFDSTADNNDQDDDDAGSTLTAAEKETIICYNNADKTASCYTLNTRRRRELLDIVERFPQQARIIRQDAESIEVEFPKDWVRISTPRQYSEETRRKAAERARALAAKRWADKDQPGGSLENP